jgi:hypothetical protein
MIDNPKLTAELLAKMEAALPFPALITPYLAGALRNQAPETSVPRNCEVALVSHAGDEGGIVCKLQVRGGAEDAHAFFTSLTHLAFDHRLPLAREISAYKKRRIKKLSRLGG